MKVALAIFAALLACCLDAHAIDWCWNPSPGADGYRLYWSNVPNRWPECNATDYPASVCVDGRCCSSNYQDGSGDLLFYVVTAYNVAGESSTEHGDIEPCP